MNENKSWGIIASVFLIGLAIWAYRRKIYVPENSSSMRLKLIPRRLVFAVPQVVPPPIGSAGTAAVGRIASDVTRLRQLEDDRSSRGLSDEKVIDVTDRVKQIDIADSWQAMTVTNDGPDTARIKINQNTGMRDWKSLQLNETWDVDYGGHRIKKLFLVCNSGKTASLRATGVF